jgi:hypothetical protein
MQDKNFVYQNFRLVTLNARNLRFFTNTKFLAHDILESEMEKYYVGDGENVFFRDKKYFKNLITVIYEKVNDASIKEESHQFEVIAPLPKTEGCFDCEYYRKKQKKCLYRRKIGIDIVENCSDFRQKR